MLVNTCVATLRRPLRGALWLLFIAVAASACGEGGVTDPPEPAVASVEVTAPAEGLQVNQTMQLTGTARDASGGAVAGKTLTWQSSSEATASVSSTGLVTGKSPGLVTVTATETSSGRSGVASLLIVPVPVASVAIEPASFSLQVGATQALTVTARDAAGNALSGRAVNLVSSNAGVASLNGSTLTAAGVGTATITASVEGKVALAQVTVTPVPVASLAIEPASFSLRVGAAQALTVTARDAAGNVLSGRAVTLVSSNADVASVDLNRVVTARAAGSATITATSEGKSASAAVSVTVPEAARIVISPAFTTLDIGAAKTLSVTASAADGSTIPNPSASWSSLGAAVASVGSTGEVSALAAGQARIAAQVNSATDTAVVAVLGTRSLLSTAWVEGSVKADVRPGQTIVVPVVLDLSKASSTGDLGAAQFELKYDPAVLIYKSAVAGASGGTEFNVPAAGTFKLSFAATSPQGTARPTLVTITFQVAPGAAAGVQRALSLVYTAQPASTSFQKYELPIAVAGRIRVIN